MHFHVLTSKRYNLCTVLLRVARAFTLRLKSLPPSIKTDMVSLYLEERGEDAQVERIMQISDTEMTASVTGLTDKGMKLWLANLNE